MYRQGDSCVFSGIKDTVVKLTFSNETFSLNALRVVTPKDIKPPTQVGSTSARARHVKAASTRTCQPF